MNPCSTWMQGYPTLDHPCVHHAQSLPFTGANLAILASWAAILAVVGFGLRKFGKK